MPLPVPPALPTPARDARELLLDFAARVAHEVNRAYCATLGDLSQSPWDEAPEWQQDSARAGAEAVLTGVINAPGASHESWSRQKYAEGWVYGEVKDVEAKTHPCLVPFEQLPHEQQVKDHLFLAVCQAIRDNDPAFVDALFGTTTSVTQGEGAFGS